MQTIFIKYAVGVYTYGTLRAAAYSPPLKKEEYMTDRIGTTIMYILSAPMTAPSWLYKDIKNLEHVVRKMPGPIDRSPWS
jgi:hypothetical protein